MSENTGIGNAESDTAPLRFVAGQTVRIAAGAMKGLIGTVVDYRTIGRILLQIDAGICVEIHQYCLEATPGTVMIHSKRGSPSKPQPLIPARVHNRCPVCGKVSYSRAGVHRQCSMRKADEKDKHRIKRENLLAKQEKPAIPASEVAPWQKCCPKCNTRQHVWKTVCGCGHAFTVRARPPTSEGERT